jgi:hypothetical protein
MGTQRHRKRNKHRSKEVYSIPQLFSIQNERLDDRGILKRLQGEAKLGIYATGNEMLGTSSKEKKPNIWESR